MPSQSTNNPFRRLSIIFMDYLPMHAYFKEVQIAPALCISNREIASFFTI